MVIVLTSAIMLTVLVVYSFDLMSPRSFGVKEIRDYCTWISVRSPSNEWWQVIEWSGRFEHDPLSFLTPLTIRHWLVLDLRHKDCFHGAEFANFAGGSLWLCMCHDHLGCLVGLSATVAFFGAGFWGEPCPFRRSKKWKASKCSLYACGSWVTFRRRFDTVFQSRFVATRLVRIWKWLQLF